MDPVQSAVRQDPVYQAMNSQNEGLAPGDPVGPSGAGPFGDMSDEAKGHVGSGLGGLAGSMMGSGFGPAGAAIGGAFGVGAGGYSGGWSPGRSTGAGMGSLVGSLALGPLGGFLGGWLGGHIGEHIGDTISMGPGAGNTWGQGWNYADQARAARGGADFGYPSGFDLLSPPAPIEPVTQTSDGGWGDAFGGPSGMAGGTTDRGEGGDTAYA